MKQGIDFTKPLETLDGHPLVWNGKYLKRVDGGPIRAGGDVFMEGVYVTPEDDRLGWGGQRVEIRNSVPTFDPTKPVQTRDGRKARILSADRIAPASSGKTVVALIESTLGYEDVVRRYPDGRVNPAREASGDLVNVPERKTTYYPMSSGGSFQQVPCSNALAAKARSTIAKALAVTCEGLDPVSAEIV